MRRKTLIFISWFGIILVLSVVLIFLLSILAEPAVKPFKDAQIPRQTKAFIANLLNKLDFNILIVDNIDDDHWLNKNDYIPDSASSTAQSRDENFIIYHDTTDKREKQMASLCLSMANQAIKPLEQLFGRYVYAKDLNGRKLPIYLAKSDKIFQKIYEKLTLSRKDTRWMGGVCINTISHDGEVLTNGIIIKDYDELGKPDAFNNTLRHEMAHYVHFQNMDFLQNKPMLWETEGFAMYFEGDISYLQNSSVKNKINSSISEIELSQDVNNYMDSYWVGYTALLFMENKYGKATLTKYVRNNYTKSTYENSRISFSKSITEFDREWTKYVLENY